MIIDICKKIQSYSPKKPLKVYEIILFRQIVWAQIMRYEL